MQHWTTGRASHTRMTATATTKRWKAGEAVIFRRNQQGEVIESRSLHDGNWYDISIADMSHKNATFEKQLLKEVGLEQTGHMDAVEY